MVAKTFDLDQPIVDAVHQVAEERGVPMAQIVHRLAAVQARRVRPIVGATKPHPLSDAVAALELHLSDDEVSRLEAPYTTQPAYCW